ncbi:MAG: hypothetical protein Q4G09_06565 [Clostridia bacterium]|nr:hypothetical protein [Clostridia bacterium]
MAICNQVQLLDFQKARFLSEDALNHRKRFKLQELSLNEKAKLSLYNSKQLNTLTVCELIEFQELYCKKQLLSGINSGKFYVSLEFSTILHQNVRLWLKSYGYYLCPNKPINYDAGCFYEVQHPTPESETKFELRW